MIRAEHSIVRTCMAIPLCGSQLLNNTFAEPDSLHNVNYAEVAATSASSFEADGKVKREPVRGKFC